VPNPSKTADFREMVSHKHVDSPMPGPSKTAAAHCERKRKKDDGERKRKKEDELEETLISPPPKKR
jgi:hypothetical protein